MPDMNDEFTEIQEQSWGGRLMQSVHGIVLGGVLFLVAFPVLWWNEGRAVRTYRSLHEGSRVVVSAAASPLDPKNEGKLVHITGKAVPDGSLRDPLFGVETTAIKLLRNVEMYQWREVKQRRTRRKLGGGKRVITTYSYRKEWSRNPIDSKTFRKPEGHGNPGTMPVRSAVFRARAVQVGAFGLSPSLIDQFSGAGPLSATEADLARAAPPPEIAGRMRIEGGAIYVGEDPAHPRVGDLRIRFRSVPPGPVSVIAQQHGNTLAPYPTKAGKPIELLAMGRCDAQTMFQNALHRNAVITWLLRAGGFVMMMLGIALAFRPIAVFGDAVPIIGGLLGAGIVVFAAIIALAFSVLTIAVAWVAVRPWFAGAAGAVVLVLIGFAVLSRSRGRTAAVER